MNYVDAQLQSNEFPAILDPSPPLKRGRPKKEKPQVATTQGFTDNQTTILPDFIALAPQTQAADASQSELLALLTRAVTALEIIPRKLDAMAIAVDGLTEQAEAVELLLDGLATMAHHALMRSMGGDATAMNGGTL